MGIENVDMNQITAALIGESPGTPVGATAFPAFDALTSQVGKVYAASRALAAMAASAERQLAEICPTLELSRQAAAVHSTVSAAARTFASGDSISRAYVALSEHVERQLADGRPARELPQRVTLHRNMSAAARTYGLSLRRLTMRQLTDVLTWKGDAESLARRTGLPVNACAVLLAMARAARTVSDTLRPVTRRPLLSEALARYSEPRAAARPVHRGISAPPWRLALVRSVQTAAPPLLGAGAERSV